MTYQPKHPIDMICTVCNALEETTCMFPSTLTSALTAVATLGIGEHPDHDMRFHLARIHAATAANQIAELLEDNRRLCELAELQSRTLGRALARWRPEARERDESRPPRTLDMPPIPCGHLELPNGVAAYLRVPNIPLESGAVVTLAINGTVNDRPLYACSQSGKLLRRDDVKHYDDTNGGATGCPNHDGALCVRIGYEA